MQLIPDFFKKEIEIRISSLRNHLIEGGIDAILVNANVNIYYLSGRFYRGYVYLPVDGQPIWFVVKPEVFDKEGNVFYIRKPELIPEILISQGVGLPKSLALEFDDLSYSDIIRLQKIFPEAEYHNGSRIMKMTRMIKTPWEIEQMKIDGLHHAKVYSKIKNCYKPGMSDLQLQIEIERELRLEGALGVSRVAGNLMEINMGSVISGENADTPSPYEFTMGGAGVDSSLPVGADNSPILPHTTVMIDMNGAFNGYQTDMTRVWALDEIPALAMKAHDCSLRILHELEKFALPGVPVADLYVKAMEIVEEEGLKEFFMGHKSQVGFIGHGVGIELNELPVVNARSKDILAENMTIALEPKFVIPEVGAVGSENTYQVTRSGLVNLTVFPEEIHNL
ncbi:MAG: aminopeptidase P family protein [Muribaculaceae bacterium]|nr:aminopeptidase P family protein [Muribaculaceae bacterium]